jgi:hypothetical protein
MDLLYALPSVQFLLHVAEEFPRFPAWATRHFGVTTRAYYVYSHIPLIVAIVAISVGAVYAPAGSFWIFLSAVAQVILFTNGVFHLATTVLFREYSPGVVTGTVLFFPATYMFMQRTIADALLTPTSLVAAAVLGAILGAAIIGSLWLDMNYDWRLRRVDEHRSTD